MLTEQTSIFYKTIGWKPGNEPPQVFVTYDYEQFKTMVGNRDVGNDRKSKIFKSVKSVGQIPIPIIVNEHMEVCDGQGRLAEFKELGLPIFYMVINGLRIEHCKALNIYQRKWGVEDYLKSGAERKLPDYVRAYALCTKHKRIGIKVVLAAASGAVLGSDISTIANDNLKVPEENIQAAENALIWLDTNFYPLKEYINGRFDCLCQALIFIYMRTDADPDRVYSVIKNNITIFPAVGTIKTTLQSITDFYNKGLTQQKRQYFVKDYEDYCSVSNAAYKTRWLKRKEKS